ncbi:hypothetical protein PoB_007359500, partial [Plakobranchus ocellatus]
MLRSMITMFIIMIIYIAFNVLYIIIFIIIIYISLVHHPELKIILQHGKDEEYIHALPKASYTCSTEIIQGYFNGKSSRCTCSLTSDGYPKGQAQWYRDSQRVPGVSGGVLDLSFDRSNPEQVYSCQGVSTMGKSSSSTLTAKFAFFEQVTVTIESSTTIDLCSETNYTNNRIPITCRVPKNKIYPAPIFSVSQEGVKFDLPREGHDDTMFYQNQFYPSPDFGGVYQVTCKVINKITGKAQEQGTLVTFRKPPLLPPKITIEGETYQGVNALNRITLAAGYTGDMTCRVEGGYPKAHSTQLTCGSLTATGGENVATLTFQDDQLNKHMDGTECKCTSQHVTGCYNEKETSLTLDVTCPQQFASNISQPVTVEVALGATAEFGLEIYGYPTPHLLNLMRTTDNTNLTESSRHLTEYSPSQVPFGSVNVTISDVVEGDFTNYIVTVDNGVGDPLLYPFSLVKRGSENDTITLAIGVTVAVVAVLVIAVTMVVLVLRYRDSQKMRVSQPAKDNKYVDTFFNPGDGYEVPVTRPEGEGMEPE